MLCVTAATVSAGRAEADIDAALDGFNSSRRGARKRAAEIFEQARLANIASLCVSLAAKIASLTASVETRILAAILLRRVIVRSRETGVGFPGDAIDAWSAGLGRAFLEALIAAVNEPTVRRHAADAVAAAASYHFGNGYTWPEFQMLLARWCSAGRSELRAVVLRILEQMGDDLEQMSDQVSGTSLENDMAIDDGDAEELHVGPCLYSRRLASGNPQAALDSDSCAPLYAVLAFLEDHGAALHTLLAESLASTRSPQTSTSEEEDQSSRDAAARIFVICAARPGTPEPLRIAVRDLALVVADVAVWSRSDTCLNAITMAARFDPVAWVPVPLDLSEKMVRIAIDTTASLDVRRAALSALMALVDAAANLSMQDSDISSSSTPAAVKNLSFVEAAERVGVHAASAAVTLLAEFPCEEATEAWAEYAEDDRVQEEGTFRDQEDLLEEAVDVVSRLAVHGGVVFHALRQAASKLISEGKAWQSRHAALLLHVRLAMADFQSSQIKLDQNRDSEQLVSNAASVALRHLSHVHPRVRWAALETWGCFLTAGHEEPLTLFPEAFECLIDAASRDSYLRVRRHALHALLCAASSSSSPLRFEHLETLFRNALIPQAYSADCGVRSLCSAIAIAIAALFGLCPGFVESDVRFDKQIYAIGTVPKASCLMQLQGDDLSTLKALCTEFELAASNGLEDSQDHPEGDQCDIEWPADWR